MAKKKAKVMLSSFSIILILIFGLGILSHVLPNAQFVGEEIVNGSGTVGATLSQVLMAPIQGSFIVNPSYEDYVATDTEARRLAAELF